MKERSFKLRHTRAPSFATPSGRLEFYSEKLKKFGEELPGYKMALEVGNKSIAKQYPLAYFSTHTRYRLHTVFSNVDWLRELDPEPVLQMNPLDADLRNIKDGDMVLVFNDRGRTEVRAKFNEGIRPGMVNMTQGWPQDQFPVGCQHALTHDQINPSQEVVFQPNASIFDNLVEVKKTET